MAKENLTNHQKRELAEVLYMETNHTQKDIAEKVGVAPQTIGKWVKKYEWEDIKAAMTLTPQRFKRKLYSIVMDIINGKREPDPKEADTLIKYARAIQKIEKQDSLANYIQAFKSFENWLSDAEPEMLKQVNELHDRFVTEKAALING